MKLPDRIASKSSWLPWAVLGLGLALTCAATSFLERSGQSRAQRRFDVAVQQARADVQSRMEAYIALLRGARALFSLEPDLNRQDWREYVSQLDLEQYYPGVLGIGFTLRIAPDELNKTVERLRKEGEADFVVWPDTPRSEYHSIIYLEPSNRRNQAAIGYDMFTEPVRREAMEQASASGAPFASRTVRLVQEVEGPAQPGFLIYLPVYRENFPIPLDVEARRRSLVGFVYSPFRAGDLFSGIFGPSNPLTLNLQVFDGPDPSEANLLFSFEPPSNANSPTEPRHRALAEVETAGRTWALAFSSSEALAGGAPWALRLLVPSLGALFSISLFLFSRAELRAGNRARSSAAELSRQRERLRVTLESIGDGVISTDLLGRVEFLNAAAEKLTGWALEQARDRPLAEVFQILDEETGSGAMSPAERVLKEGETAGLPSQALLLARDGSARSIEETAAPIRDASGNVLGVILVFHDVTDERRDERHLKLQHDLTRILSEADSISTAIPAILQSVSLGLCWDVAAFWEADEESARLRCLDVWHRPQVECDEFIRLSREIQFQKGQGLPGRVWSNPLEIALEDVSSDSNFPRGAAAARAGLQSALAFPTLVDGCVFGVFEFFSLQSKRRNQIFVESKTAVGAQIESFIKRKRSEAALQLSEERHRIIAQTVADGIVAIDEHSIVQSFNPAAERIFGYTADEMIGGCMTQLIPERFQAAHRAGVARFLHTGKRGISWSGIELPGRHKDGTEMPLEISFGFAREGERVLFTGLIRDITERKRVEQRLHFMAQASALLSESLNYRKTLKRLAELAVPVVADWCVIHLAAGDESLESLVLAHSDPAKTALAEEMSRRYPPRSDSPRMKVLRTGEPEWVPEISEVLLEKLAHDAGHLALLRQLGLASLMVLPLRAQHRIAGTLTLVNSHKSRSFDRQDLEFAEDLAARAGMAIENALLFRSAQDEIDRRTRTETALRESEERLRTIVESAEDHAIFTLDLQGRITSWNTGARLIFGHSEDEILGQSTATLFTTEDRENGAPEAEMRSAFETGRANDERWHLRRDGERFFASGSLVPLRAPEDAQIYGYLKILRDQTTQRTAQEALRSSREALHAAQIELQEHTASLEKIVQQRTARLSETIGELEAFSYSISHDLRAPLRAMNAYAQSLLDEYAENLEGDGKRYLERICSATVRMDRLIADVLSYSRVARTDSTMHPVDVELLVQEMLYQYPPLQPPHAEVQLVSPMLSVVAEEASLTQCLSNLMMNAIKFVAPGVQPRIRIWTEKRAETVRIWVEDNGIGIEPKHQAKIFGIFERVHPEQLYEGTGIGLAIVKKAVQRMAGEVGVESELGRGSRFWIELKGNES